VLPSDVSRAPRPVAERRLLPDGVRGGACRVSSVLALPARSRTGHAGVAWRRGDRLARAQADRPRIPRREVRRRAGGYARRRGTTSATSLSEARGRIPAGRGLDAAGSARQDAAGRDGDADLG